MSQDERDEIIHETLTELETNDANQEANPEYLETLEDIFGAQNENDTVEGIFQRLRVSLFFFGFCFCEEKRKKHVTISFVNRKTRRNGQKKRSVHWRKCRPLVSK